jgi:5'-deoxynucleotidase
VNLSKMFGVLSGLSGTYRFSNAKLIHRESVLEHLGAVALTCYLIVNELSYWSGRGDVDLGEVMGKAIVHDVEELLTGDIPRPMKYSSPATRAHFKLLENDMFAKIVSDMDLSSSSEVISDWVEAKQGVSGLVVDLADVLAVVYKVHEEAVERGNKTMLSRAGSANSQLRRIRERVREEFSGFQLRFLEGIVDQASEVMRIAETIETNSISEDVA